jgi:multiple sugar transport system substrate-binding protein
VSIIQVYRKIIEKSRSPGLSFFGLKRIDSALFFAAAAAALCIIIIKLSIGISSAAGRTELLASSRCEALLGRETAEALIREFEEQNPDLRIRLAGENAGDKNSAVPDVLFFEEGEYSALVKAGALVSLNSYISTENRSEQFAIPLVSYRDLLFYNIDLLKAAGFDRPPKTRNEFLACAKAVSALGADNSVYGAALSLSADDPLALQRDVFSWVWAAGGDFGPADKPHFNSKTITDTLVFLGRLYSEGALAGGSFDTTSAERLAEFANGKIGLLIASAKEIPGLQKKMGDSFGVTMIPGTDSPAKSRAVLSSVYAGISAASAHRDEAWTFLVFLAEKSPVLAAKMPGAVEGPLYEKVRDISEAAETTPGFSGNPQRDEYERIVREELRAFLEQNQSPVDTTARIQKRRDLIPF